MANVDRGRSAAILVGRLIRSYRSEASRNGRRLTQEGLLDLMAERGEEGVVRLDRSNVSHWETGVRRPPREFLEAFGRTLDVPEGEVHLMLALAGHESFLDNEGQEAMLAAASSIESIESMVESVQEDVRNLADLSSGTPTPLDASSIVRRDLRRAVLPGIYVLAVGFLLNFMGQAGTAVLLAYALVAASLVIGQWVLQFSKSDRDTAAQENIAGLFFISLFITLNSAVLIGSATKTDHFGFYTLGFLTNTAWPFALTMVVNLALALAGLVFFSLLWRHEYGPSGSRSGFIRAVFITLPPIVFVYANILIFTNSGGWTFFLSTYGVMFGAFTAIIGFSEPGLRLGTDDFVLKATVVTIILLSVVGVIGLIIAYLDPGMFVASANLRIISLPEVSATELGYTAQEEVYRFRLGMIFMNLTNILYMAIVVGGYLIATVYRATDRSPASEVEN